MYIGLAFTLAFVDLRFFLEFRVTLVACLRAGTELVRTLSARNGSWVLKPQAFSGCKSAFDSTGACLGLACCLHGLFSTASVGITTWALGPSNSVDSHVM